MPKSTISHLEKAVQLQRKMLDKPKPDRREEREDAADRVNDSRDREGTRERLR